MFKVIYAVMRQSLISLLLISVLHTFGFGQSNSNLSFSNYFTLSASRYNPAIIGTNVSSTELVFLNSYAWISNNTIDHNAILYLFEGGESRLSLEDIKLNDMNTFQFGAIVDVLSFSKRFHRRDVTGVRHELFTIGGGVSERVQGELYVNDNLANLTIHGNAQFEGMTVPLKVGLTAWVAREYYLSTSIPLTAPGSDLFLKAGVRGTYIRASVGVKMKENFINFSTSEHGREISVEYDYIVNSTIDLKELDATSVSEMTRNYLDPTPDAGTGAAFSFGLSAEWKNRWIIDASLIDIGGISFNNNKKRKTYRTAGTYSFSGVDVDNIDGQQAQIDSLLHNITKLSETDLQTFYVDYPTRMSVGLSYRISHNSRKSVFSHFVSVLIQKELSAGNILIDDLGMVGGYTVNVANILEVGNSIGMKAGKIDTWGANLGIKCSILRIGVGSTNALSWLINDSVKELDAAVNIGLVF